MAVSEDHASCWVFKDLTVTTKQIQALLTAARASGGKDEERDNVVYWKTKRKINDDLQLERTNVKYD